MICFFNLDLTVLSILGKKSQKKDKSKTSKNKRKSEVLDMERKSGSVSKQNNINSMTGKAKPDKGAKVQGNAEPADIDRVQTGCEKSDKKVRQEIDSDTQNCESHSESEEFAKSVKTKLSKKTKREKNKKSLNTFKSGSGEESDSVEAELEVMEDRNIKKGGRSLEKHVTNKISKL